MVRAAAYSWLLRAERADRMRRHRGTNVAMHGYDSGISSVDVKSKIEAALQRSAEVDARRIHVATGDSKVMLSGNVHSWSSATRRGERRGRPRA